MNTGKSLHDDKQERLDELLNKRNSYLAIYMVTMVILLLLVCSIQENYSAGFAILMFIISIYFSVKGAGMYEEIKSLKADLGLIPKPIVYGNYTPKPVAPEMTTCKACKNVVSKTAPSCPKCGEAFPGLRVSCPKCGSMSFMAGKRGFSPKNAIVGIALAGPAGTLGGFVGSENIEFLCVKCGHRWKPDINWRT